MDSLRSHRIAGIAVFDLVASTTLAVLLGVFLLHLGDDVADWVTWLLCWTALGVVVHRVLGVRTVVGQALGLDD